MVKDIIVENPDYMIIGECPGKQEEQEGIPFVGRSGQLLWRLLNTVGIEKEKCHVTNIVPERPPKNNFGVFYKDKKRTEATSELLEFYQILRRKIRQMHPRMVIGLGGESLKALTGRNGIERWRGTIFEVEGQKCIVTFHPSAVMRGGGTNHWYLPAMLADLEKAKEEIDNPVPYQEPKYYIIDNPDYLDRWFVKNVNRFVSFDIETTLKGGDKILCIGFAADPNNGFVVPFGNDMIDNFELQEVIKKWMSGDQIKWVAQNGYGFDINYIRKCWGFEVKNYTFDTMVAHHILHPELPHDLGALTSFYTRMQYYKHLAKTDLYLYNAYDAIATWIIAQKQMKELHDRNLWDIYNDYYHPLLISLRNMNWRGIKIDKLYQKELKQSLKLEINQHQTELDAMVRSHTNVDSLRLRLRRLQRLDKANKKSVRLTNKKTGKRTKRRVKSLLVKIKKEIESKQSINVRSHKQMCTLLYNVLHLPVQKTKGKISADEASINTLYLKTNDEFLKKIILLRRAENNMSKYGKLPTDSDGKVRTTYSFAETGRLRSGKFSAK